MALYKRLVKETEHLVDKLVKNSGLDRDLVRNIIKFTRCMTKPNTGRLDLLIVRAVLFKYFNIDDQEIIRTLFDNLRSKSSNLSISVESFANIICIYFSDFQDIKIDYAFSIFDIDKNGILEYTEIVRFVEKCKCVTDIDDNDREETFNDMLTMAMDQLKISRTQGKSLEEFRKIAHVRSFFQSLFAQCFPPGSALKKMLEDLSNKSTHEVGLKFATMRMDLLCEWPEKSVMSYYPVPLDLP